MMTEDSSMGRLNEVELEGFQFRKEKEERETARKMRETQWSRQDAKANALIREAEEVVSFAFQHGWDEAKVAFFQDSDVVRPPAASWEGAPEPAWLKQPYRKVFNHFADFAKNLARPAKCAIKSGRDPKSGIEGWLIVVVGQ